MDAQHDRWSFSGPAGRPEVSKIHPPFLSETSAGEAFGAAARARRLLRERDGLAQAVILAELLGPPRARRPWRPRIGS